MHHIDRSCVIIGKILKYHVPQQPPLSIPFLFVADGLSRLVERRIESGELQELRICRQSPGISHLVFAKNILLVFKASPDQVNIVKQLLNNYNRTTGQLLSPTKFSLLLENKCSPYIGGPRSDISLNTVSMRSMLSAGPKRRCDKW